MHFTFSAIVNNTQVKLTATGIYAARDEAKKLGATACNGFNPSTRRSFAVSLQR